MSGFPRCGLLFADWLNKDRARRPRYALFPLCEHSSTFPRALDRFKNPTHLNRKSDVSAVFA